MISDTLSEAIEDIDEYLQELPDVYTGAMREWIVSVRNQMEAVRIELDTPPRMDSTEEGGTNGR